MNFTVDNLEKLAGPCRVFQLLRLCPQESSREAGRRAKTGVLFFAVQRRQSIPNIHVSTNRGFLEAISLVRIFQHQLRA